MARRGDSIRKRKDGRWEGRYMVTDRNGERKKRSVYATSYTECKNKLSERIRDSRTEPPAAPKKGEPLDRIADLWLGMVKDTKKHSTYAKYARIYRKYLKPILEKHPGAMPDWNAEIFDRDDISASNKECISAILGGILGQAEKFGWEVPRLKSEFARGRQKPVEIFNDMEQAHLLNYLYENMDSYKMGIVLCLSTGLRLGELCSLRYSDVDMRCGVLQVNNTVQRIAVEGAEGRTALLESVPKTECSQRQIPLSDEMLSLLGKYGTEGDYVIGGSKPVEPRTYQNRYRKYLREAGISYRNFHVLRHTFASNCISHGMDAKSVSEIMGHSNVRITLNRYTHPTMEAKRGQMNTLSDVYGQMRGQAKKKA